MFAARSDGRYDVKLAPETRLGLAALAAELDSLITSDLPETRRLFPTAYPDDPERDAGYQIFARNQLIDQRREAVEVVHRTVEADVLTEEELGAWMGVLNDLRLVIGTKLDVSEDDEDIDPEHPDAQSYLLYHLLGEIVHNIVIAMTGNLPEPEEGAAG